MTAYINQAILWTHKSFIFTEILINVKDLNFYYVIMINIYHTNIGNQNINII